MRPAKMTTRSRSQAEGTPGLAPNDAEESQPGTTATYSKNNHDEDTPSGDDDPLSDPPPSIEDRIENEKAEALRLQTRIEEIRRSDAAAVNARIQELEQQEAYRRELEQELEELIRPFRPRRKRTRSPPSHDDDDEPARRRTSRGAPKFRDLPTYYGKDLKEAQGFVHGAERRFRIDNGTRYRSDQDRIDYCVLAFGPGPAAKWERHEQRQGLGNTTWQQFTTWMKDDIADPTNREFEAATRYHDARQGERQSAEDLAAYLDTLELELKIDDDKYRKDALYAKLRPDIRTEILIKNEIPETRHELLALATRIETTRRINGQNRQPREDRVDPAPHNQSRGRQRRNDSTPRREGTPPRTGGERRRGNTPATGVNRTPTDTGLGSSGPKCPRCQSTSHRLSNCPEVTCFKCQKKGHIAPVCPELTGKDVPRR